MTSSRQIPIGFRHYLFELVVLVTGITLSFFLNEWRLDRKGEEALELDLLAVRQNLLSDKEELEELILVHEKAVQSMGDFFAYAEGTKDPEDFHGTVIDFFQSGMSFFPDTGARNAMVSSGNIRWLENPSLSRSLSEYYDHMVPRILDNNRLIDRMLVSDLFLWFHGLHPHSEKVDNMKEPFPVSILDEPGFFPRISGHLAHARWYLEILNRAKAKIQRAMDEIDQHLAST